MFNMRNDIRYDIDKYCMKQEDEKIFTHTHKISIDDLIIIIAVGRMRQRLPSFPVLHYGVSPYISL